ncbi:hypothetical protein P9112_003070 [Eukaryota sp. TZLM1-RC]
MEHNNIDYSVIYRHLFKISENNSNLTRELLSRLQNEINNNKVFNSKSTADLAWFLGTLWNLGVCHKSSEHIDIAEKAFQLSLHFAQIVEELPPIEDKKLRQDVSNLLANVSSTKCILALLELRLTQIREQTISTLPEPNSVLYNSLIEAKQLLSRIKNNDSEKEKKNCILLNLEVMLILQDQPVLQYIDNLISENVLLAFDLLAILQNNQALKISYHNLIVKLLLICLDNYKEGSFSVALLVKSLIELSTDRQSSKQYYVKALTLIDALTAEEVNWFGISAWNNGVFYTRLTDYKTAEEWVGLALKFKDCDGFRQAYREILPLCEGV